MDEARKMLQNMEFQAPIVQMLLKNSMKNRYDFTKYSNHNFSHQIYESKIAKHHNTRNSKDKKNKIKMNKDDNKIETTVIGGIDNSGRAYFSWNYESHFLFLQMEPDYVVSFDDGNDNAYKTIIDKNNNHSNQSHKKNDQSTIHHKPKARVIGSDFCFHILDDELASENDLIGEAILGRNYSDFFGFLFFGFFFVCVLVFVFF